MARDAESANKTTKATRTIVYIHWISNTTFVCQMVCMFFFILKTLDVKSHDAKFEDEQNRSSGSGDMGKKVVKKCQIGVRVMFFEKISRNITDTEKMMMTNIIGNSVADYIVFGTEVLAHHPEELSLEIWELTNFHQVS